MQTERNLRNVSECIVQQKTLAEMSGRSESNSRDQRFFLGREAVLLICSALLPFQFTEHEAFHRFFARTSSKFKTITRFQFSII